MGGGGRGTAVAREQRSWLRFGWESLCYSEERMKYFREQKLLLDNEPNLRDGYGKYDSACCARGIFTFCDAELYIRACKGGYVKALSDYVSLFAGVHFAKASVHYDIVSVPPPPTTVA